MRNDVSEMLRNYGKQQEMIMPIIQTNMVIIHGTLDGILLYSESLNKEMFLENVWNTFWNGIENTINI